MSYDSGTKYTVAMGAYRLWLRRRTVPLRLMRRAHATFLSDAPHCPMMMSKSVCRTTMSYSGSRAQLLPDGFFFFFLFFSLFFNFHPVLNQSLHSVFLLSVLSLANFSTVFQMWPGLLNLALQKGSVGEKIDNCCFVKPSPASTGCDWLCHQNTQKV